MDNKVDGNTGSVQGHITSVQRSILGLAQALVVDTSDSAKEGLEDEHDIGCKGIRGTGRRVVLRDNKTTDLKRLHQLLQHGRRQVSQEGKGKY